MAAPSFAYLAVFALLIGLLYAAICRPPSVRQSIAWFLAVAALIPLYGGATILLAEHRRSQDGRVIEGFVAEKSASVEAESSNRTDRRRHRGRSQALLSLVIGLGYDLPDAIARLIATGSLKTPVVEYRYDCGGAPCRGRDIVSERLWSELSVGQAVTVRPAGGHGDSPRLDANQPWPAAIGRLGVGAMLLIGAGFASGRWASGPKYLTVPAVVTAVDPVDYGQAVRWRIRFAYFAPDGTALESADEVVAPGLKPGDDCIAVYPPDQPDLGTLRLVQRA